MAIAQSPEEILSRMEEAMNQQQNDGVSLTMDLSIPIIGTFTTKSLSLGDKMRLEVGMGDESSVRWFDGETVYTYEEDTNEIVITKKEGTQSAEEKNGNLNQFEGIADDYKVSIDKETSDAWYLTCKIKRSNRDKEAPKRIELVIDKKTYLPRSISTKAAGIRVTLRDLGFNVTEEQVTFNPKNYPNAKIVDQR
ncbi:MAG: hypothetical protein K6A28_01745 [Bacteroidales bacterium]|nr:hypothetical protein [Bacteroidales bacterium]